MSTDRDFLRSVLGNDGARALEKATDRAPGLRAILVPRALMSWLDTQGEAYEGQIPGVGDSYLALQKAQDGLHGAITIGEGVYTFEGVSPLHVAAVIALALGIDAGEINPALRKTDLSQLGKSIDLLIRARLESKKLKDQKLKDQEKSPDTEKAERPGPAAAPRQQEEPETPTAPTKQRAMKPVAGAVQPNNLTQQPQPKPAQPGLAAPKPVKITKSEMEHAQCPTCGESQFHRDEFVGCYCLKGLAKSGDFAITRAEDGQYTFRFGRSWDKESITTLVDMIKR